MRVIKVSPKGPSFEDQQKRLSLLGSTLGHIGTARKLQHDSATVAMHLATQQADLAMKAAQVDAQKIKNQEAIDSLSRKRQLFKRNERRYKRMLKRQRRFQNELDSLGETAAAAEVFLMGTYSLSTMGRAAAGFRKFAAEGVALGFEAFNEPLPSEARSPSNFRSLRRTAVKSVPETVATTGQLIQHLIISRTAVEFGSPAQVVLSRIFEKISATAEAKIAEYQASIEKTEAELEKLEPNVEK